MTSMGHPTTSSVYAAVLARRTRRRPSRRRATRRGRGRRGPAKEKADAEADDKGGQSATRRTREGRPKPVKIDFDGIDQRIVALPIERANYVSDLDGGAGVLFLAGGAGRAHRRGLRRARRRTRAARRLALRSRRSARPRSSSRRSTAPRRRRDVLKSRPTARRSSTRRTRSGSSSPRTRRPRPATASSSSTARGVGRPARRVAADLPRGLAHRARLPLRPARARARSRGGGEALRAVPRRDRGARRPQRAHRGGSRRTSCSGTSGRGAGPTRSRSA
jgi:hypothetical protein